MERKSFTGRNWMITIQAPIGADDSWRCCLPESWYEETKYMAQVYERGRDALSCHTHILVAFKKTKRSTVLAKNLIVCNKGSEIDVQLKKGNWEDAINYILKQDETRINGRVPVERGDRPREYISKEKKKEDVYDIMETIKEGGLGAVVEEHADYIMKYPSGCKLLKELVAEKSRKRTVSVTIIWGDAGTGKTTWATQEGERKWGAEDVYHFTKVGGSRDTIWFNNYSGQKCLIMDDITGRTMPFEYMLKILGNDPLDIEIKGGREAAIWEDIYITSNYDPMCWYSKVWNENEESRRAFFRRVQRIIHVFREGEEVTWQVQKEDDVHIMTENFHITPNWERTPRWVREERRCEEERTNLRDEDINVLNLTREESTEKSGIGLIDSKEEEEGTPDTPGRGMYWGGGDGFKRMHSPSSEQWIRRNAEREAAFSAFCKKFNIVRRANSGAELSEGEIRAAIRDGRLKYDEKTWLALIERGEDIRRSHVYSEEEWSPEGGYHDLRHEEEIEELYDIIKGWSTDDPEQSFGSQWWEKERIEEIE